MPKGQIKMNTSTPNYTAADAIRFGLDPRLARS